MSEDKHRFVYAAPDTCKCGDKEFAPSHIQEPVNTTNKFLVSVGSQPAHVVILNIPARIALSNEDALNLAAWLVACADPTQLRFRQVLSEVLNT